jgi:hypothetical protein
MPDMKGGNVKTITLFVLGAVCSYAATIPRITVETSSDVPIAQIRVGAVDVGGLPPDGAVVSDAFSIGVSIWFPVFISCSPEPVMECGEYWERLNGLPVGSTNHSVNVVYEWSVPLLIEGEGTVDIVEEGMPQMVSEVLDGGETVHVNSSSITAPTTVQRGVPFEVFVKVAMRADIWNDYESFQAGVYKEFLIVDAPGDDVFRAGEAVLPIPEPSITTLIGGGLLLLACLRKRANVIVLT